MNRTGHYEWIDGVFRLVDDTPTGVGREVYFKEPYYDKSARRRFESKREKRNWLKDNKMREGGLIKPKEVGL